MKEKAKGRKEEVQQGFSLQRCVTPLMNNNAHSNLKNESNRPSFKVLR